MIEIDDKKINEIAQNLNAGLLRYLNIKTSELLDLPDNYEDFDDEDAIELFGEISKKIEDADFKKIPLLESYEDFDIMKCFIDKVYDTSLQSKLEIALEGRKPFATFRNIIDNSDFRESWFAHRHGELEKYVKEQLQFIEDEENNS